MHTDVDVDVDAATWSDCGRAARAAVTARAGNGLSMKMWCLRVPADYMTVTRQNCSGGYCSEVDIRKRGPAKR
jgi:hypothetical protein